MRDNQGGITFASIKDWVPVIIICVAIATSFSVNSSTIKNNVEMIAYNKATIADMKKIIDQIRITTSVNNAILLRNERQLELVRKGGGS